MEYYETMGVDEKASDDQIKKAYRKLARKYHPDVSKDDNAEEKFKKLGEAYEVLRDPKKRAEYDEFRKYGSVDQGFTPPPGWGAAAAGGEGSRQSHDTSSFFEEIFGNQRRADDGFSFAMDGDDARYRVQIDLHEACHGSSREITFQTRGIDQRGEVQQKLNTLKITIPAGVTNGQQLRLKGKGNPGLSGGHPGDLYLEIEILPHPHFSLDGRDLTLVLPVTPWEVALSESVEVPTFSSPVKLKIPAGAKPGQKLRLKGKGLPGKPPGDLFVVLQITLPSELSKSDQKLYEQMKQQMSFNPRDRIKV